MLEYSPEQSQPIRIVSYIDQSEAYLQSSKAILDIVSPLSLHLIVKSSLIVILTSQD